MLWNEHFNDPKQRLGTADIQIDLFSEDPLIVVEVTNFVDTLDKLSKFIRKIEFITEKYQKDPIAAIIAYEVSTSISKDVDDLLEVNNIKLITLGRNDYFDW